MTGTIRKETINCNTLEELIRRDYADYTVIGGSAPMDMDVTHGVEIKTADNSRHGYGITVSIYPFIEWSDGAYKPCHYWGLENYIVLKKF